MMPQVNVHPLFSIVLSMRTVRAYFMDVLLCPAPMLFSFAQQAAVRERTQAAEKLAAAEEEAGRLRTSLSSVSTTAEEVQASLTCGQPTLFVHTVRWTLCHGFRVVNGSVAFMLFCLLVPGARPGRKNHCRTTVFFRLTPWNLRGN